MKLYKPVDLTEEASVGSTSSGSVATVSAPLGAVQKRTPYSMFVGNETSDATPNTPKEYKNYKKTTKF